MPSAWTCTGSDNTAFVVRNGEETSWGIESEGAGANTVTSISPNYECVVTATSSLVQVRSYDPDVTMMLAMILAILSIFLWQYIFKPFISSK